MHTPIMLVAWLKTVSGYSSMHACSWENRTLIFFFDNANQQKTGYDKSYFDIAQKTLKPYLDAGKVVPFSGLRS
ncbi:hypothetical protein DZJ_20240 [Dickeya ananatis]